MQTSETVEKSGKKINIILESKLSKYLVVMRTTRIQFLVVHTIFLVVIDTRTPRFS